MCATFHESRENTAMDHTRSLHDRPDKVNAAIGGFIQTEGDLA
jgi:hypothetical protein